MTAAIDLTTTGRVATMTLAREAKRNALSADFAAAFVATLDEAAASQAAIVVLRSSAAVFSAGVDLSESMRLDESSPELIIADALSRTRLFVVTVVEGPALAGGLIIAALSPVVIASEEASFWLPERGIGIFPGRVLAFLEQVMPPRQAFWYGVTENRIDAAAAVRVGLVSTVASDVDDSLTRVTGELAAADPAFLSAARESWQDLFTTDAHRSRRHRLDELLETNVAQRKGDDS